MELAVANIRHTRGASVRDIGVERTVRHDAGINAGPLQRGEQTPAVFLMGLLGVPNLEYVDLVFAEAVAQG